MCLSRFQSISSTRLLPVHKYIRQATVDISPNTKLVKYAKLHDSLAKLLPSNIQKQLKNIPTITNFSTLTEEMNAVGDIHKQAGLLLKNIQSYKIDEIRSLCCNLYKLDSDAAYKSTHFKRCVMYIDLLENKH